ncbi:ACT domain-containing protein [Neolewinella agarilytica]|uniref:Aspartate kinase n=1 Tax=Neolewinella agarilytica TaxID=478744 RepID=A0A1H9P0J9_9BACT|nr:ACT domain-containing protein [Neolewinella agarilytica]SER41746.1 hypothetical protein SAMN05444359_14126 [Neolewinella agarilytica]
MSSVSDLSLLLQQMNPVLQPGAFVFTTSSEPHPAWESPAVAIVKEPEGITYVLPRSLADAEGIVYDFVAAWIMLTVHSDLEAVGLTAAVSTALADAGISCNVVAGFYHDHLFVPQEKQSAAMKALQQLTLV